MARARTMTSPIVFSRAPAPFRGGAIVKHGGSARLAALKAKAKAGLSRAATRTRLVAYQQRHKIASIGVGVGLGLLRRYAPETMTAITFGPVGPEAVIGIGALIASYFIKNEYLDAIATGALTVAGFQFASGVGVEGVGEF